MRKIDWMYHRKNCQTCAKAQDFIAKSKVIQTETVDARKTRLSKEDALKLAAGAKHIYATKGKKVISVDMAKDKPDAEALSALIVGPSGNLRAPTAWVGKTLLVGFDEGMYTNALG